MTIHTIEFRIDRTNGVHFVGIDEANLAIKNGGKVIAIEDGEAIFEKHGEEQGNVRLTLLVLV